MKLQTRAMLLILSVFILALAVMGFVIFSASSENIRLQNQDQLESLSDTIEFGINSFLESQEKKIELIAIQDSLTAEELNEMLKLDNTFYDFFWINSSGYVLISTNSERMGLYRGNRTYFTEARNKTYLSPFYYALVPGAYSIAVSTPFNGGVLVGSMKLEVLNQFVSSRIGLGKTGESLLAFSGENESLVYFSERRFSNLTFEVLQKEDAEKRPIYGAILGKEGLIEGSTDYRGEKVLAYTNYLDRIKIGMVTKIDLDETYENIIALRNKTIILVCLTLLTISLLVLVLSKRISKELSNLSEKIEIITKGDLNVQLDKSNINEIQKLIDSLNRILASMKLAILRTGLSKSELGLGEAIKAKEEAEDKYKLLYETSGDAIMTLEPPKWNFTAGNPATIKLFNLKDENQLAALNPEDLSPKYQSDKQLSSVKAKKMIEKAMKEGSVSFEWTHKKYNGESFPANVLLSRVKEKDRVYLQATVRDISKEKQAEEEHSFTNEILKNMAEGVYIVGSDDVIIKYANSKFEKMFGYKHGEMIGKPASIVNAPTDKSPEQRAKEIMKVIRRTGEWHGEVNNIKKDGTRFWCYANVSTMVHPRYGKVLIAIHRDITKEKEAEEALKKISKK
jgi:PAS domain S-box-containing protein